MKNKEFVETLAAKCNLQKKEAGAIVEAFWDIVVTTITKGDEVVSPFGKFFLHKKAAGTARNPRTGEVVKTAAKIVPKFRPNKALKEAVQGKPKAKK